MQSQAGTPEKALLEAIMNAVDAGATVCDITVHERGYVVKDDGRGFQGRTEIDQFFETFGTPHKEGDACYGKYRMGRGQLFAFSTTVWLSSTFSMAVDIKNRGLNYDLYSNMPNTPGCTITGTWYEPIDMIEVIRIIHDLSQLAQWMHIPVLINGKKINKSVSEYEWTKETDDAYISTKTAGGLAVYNMGALVRIYPPYQFGLSGIIVSKSALQVNFARNEILLSQCQVWKRIRRELDKMCGKLTQKKTLYDFERDAIATRFARGEVTFSEVAGIGLIKDVSGNRRTLRELSNAEKVCVVADQKDWTIGERVMNQKLAFVINSQTLHRFNVDTPGELIELLKSRTNITEANQQLLDVLKKAKADIGQRKRDYFKLIADTLDNPRKDPGFLRLENEENEVGAEYSRLKEMYPYNAAFDHIKIIELSEVSSHINDIYELIEKSELRPHQLAMLQALQDASEAITDIIRRQRYQRLSEKEKEALYQLPYRSRIHYQTTTRNMIIGKSDVADAWTDGESFIAVNLQVITQVLNGKKSVSSLVSLLIHEYCHEEPDAGGHIHSPDFYELFHEFHCDSWMAETVRNALLKGYAKAIAELGKKPNATLAREVKQDSKALGPVFDKMGEVTEGMPS